MSSPVNNATSAKEVTQQPIQAAKPEEQGQLEGRKVSNWQKFKNWAHDNRKAIATIILIAAVVAGITGFGLALSAGLGVAGLLTVNVTGGIALSGLTPTATVAVAASIAGAAKTFFAGISVFFIGSCLACASGGFLAGTAHK